MKRFLLIFILAFETGCQHQVVTYVPPPIVELQPSFDGDKQNSGLLDYVDGQGFLITSGAAERYRSLTKKYGSTLTPPVQEGQGLKLTEGSNYILSPEYMQVFMELSRLNKQ